MKIIFEKHEAEEMFHDALCNGLGYIGAYGLSLRMRKKDYEQAKLTIEKDGAKGCYEDYMMQILKDGNKLKLVDEEGDESWSITLEDVHERMSNVDFEHLVDMAQGNDDAVTADVILQTIFIQEVMFG